MVVVVGAVPPRAGQRAAQALEQGQMAAVGAAGYPAGTRPGILDYLQQLATSRQLLSFVLARV